MSEDSDHLSYFLIFHRRLGCSDESSTDDEQRERVLYFYPQDTSVAAQLSKLSMVEGLIEFTNKFSQDPVEYITMTEDTWAFLQCEKDTWLAVAVKNDSKPKRHSMLPFRHRPNGPALLKTLQQIYQLYATFHGSLAESLEGKSGTGWGTIEEVQRLKKGIRKIYQRRQQEEQDLASASRDPEDEIYDCEDVVEGVPPPPPKIKDEAKIAEYSALVDISRVEMAEERSKLETALSSGSYTPQVVSAQLSRFMIWYLASGDLRSPGVFHYLKGQKISSVISPASAPIVVRIRQAVQESTGGLCSKCMLICDGGTVWSDFGDDTSRAVSELLRLQEFKATRESYTILMTLSAAGVDFVAPNNGPVDSSSPSATFRSISAEQARSGTTLKGLVRRVSTIISRKSEQMITAEKWQKQEEDWGMYMLSRKGFISEGWQTLDASTLGFPPAVPSSSSSSPQRRAGFVSAGGALETNSQDNIDMISYQCEKTLGVWCPSIYECFLPSSSSSTPYFMSAAAEVEPDLTVTRLGRILVFRYCKTFLVTLFEGWGQEEDDLPKISSYPVRSASPVEADDKSFGLRLATLISVVQQQLVTDLAELEASFNPVSSVRATYDHAESKYTLPENIKMLCYNRNEGSLRSFGFPEPEICPLSLWPVPLGSRRGRYGTDDTHRSPSSTAKAQGRSESIDDVERVVSDRVVRAIVSKFSHPPSLQASLVDPVILNSLNDFVDSFHRSPQQSDICVRIGSAHRGGLWALARRFGDREVYLIVEGCNTLNEVQDQLKKTDLARICGIVSS
jgi:hypothetical protein